MGRMGFYHRWGTELCAAASSYLTSVLQFLVLFKCNREPLLGDYSPRASCAHFTVKSPFEKSKTQACGRWAEPMLLSLFVWNVGLKSKWLDGRPLSWDGSLTKPQAPAQPLPVFRCYSGGNVMLPTPGTHAFKDRNSFFLPWAHREEWSVLAFVGLVIHF